MELSCPASTIVSGAGAVGSQANPIAPSRDGGADWERVASPEKLPVRDCPKR
jgi:hypothetical protein